jgi:hypothetical protein
MRAACLPFVAVTCLLVAGCPGTEPRSFEGRNNSAVLSGIELGSGSVDVSLLRKPVAIEVKTPRDELRVDEAFLLRRTDLAGATASKNGTLAFAVTNVGDHGECFIRAEQVFLRDAAGESVAIAQNAYVFGSVGDVSGDNVSPLTPSCLARGERGWFLIASPAWDEVVSADFIWRVADALPRDPSPKLIPTGYERQGQTLRLNYRNDGQGRANTTDQNALLLLLDAEGKPLWWSIARDNLQPDSLVVAPAQTGSVDGIGAFGDYEGRASTVLAVLTFSSLSVGTSGP